MDERWSTDGANHYYYYLKQAVHSPSFKIHTEYLVNDDNAVLIKKDDHFIKTNVIGKGVKTLNERFIFDSENLYWYEAEYEHLAGGGAKSTVWLEALPYSNIKSFE